ncbi:hypothetical protein QAD02_009653 [Eretmocerus hayati]|uniref:Uncharacterized protein n=1 Tax=Eretmocerus hayati TaxID=131215 RepID=A0ACC2N9Z2_9HYME|nr:hypothetical protein QAD02_009653 [Eretmocerus hayati]
MPSCCTSTTAANVEQKQPCKEQYLFLLEFYVRFIQSPRLAKLNEMFFVPTTVNFRFLDFRKDPELALTPVDPMFEPQAGVADDAEPFYSGRSVLFALNQDTVMDTCQEFKICMNVVKKMPEGIRPDVLVGRGQIDMSCHFAALRKELIDNTRYTGSYIPNQFPSKSFEGEILLEFEGCPCGLISVFSRLSAYGQSIITEFDAPRPAGDCGPSPARSFLFKANDPDCADQILGYKCRLISPSDCDFGNSSSDDQKKCYACQQPKLPCSPCKVGSGARLPQSCGSKKPAIEDVQNCGASQAQKCPAQVNKPMPVSSCSPDPCGGPIQTSRGPKEPCGKAVVLKVSGLIDVCGEGGSKEARVTVAGENDACDPCKAADPDFDTFVLRIGKKGLVGADEKSDIQLEMRTPKGPDRRPPVRLETREMQTEEEKAGGRKGSKGGKKKK